MGETFWEIVWEFFWDLWGAGRGQAGRRGEDNKHYSPKGLGHVRVRYVGGILREKVFNVEHKESYRGLSYLR
jgi:hypothetical protein